MNEYMKLALKEAEKANKKGEIPVGAVIIKDNKVLARAHNNRQFSYSVIGHAEINAILKAEKKLKDWRLNECELYVTLEPCEMCNMIIKEARIKTVHYLLTKENIESQVSDFEVENYRKMLQNFFQIRRK